MTTAHEATHEAMGENPPSSPEEIANSMDMMSTTTISGRSRVLTGGLCAAALFQWIIELLKDNVEDNKRAAKKDRLQPSLRQVCADGFIKLRIDYAMGMTMLNEYEINTGLDTLIDRGIIICNWPEEDGLEEGGSYGHCWVRLNFKLIRELDAKLFGGL